MIKPAAQVRAEMKENKEYKTQIANAVALVEKEIERRKSLGLAHGCFCVRPEYREEVRAMFENAGYYFRPTGVVGGVYQLTEDICW